MSLVFKVASLLQSVGIWRDSQQLHYYFMHAYFRQLHSNEKLTLNNLDINMH